MKAKPSASQRTKNRLRENTHLTLACNEVSLIEDLGPSLLFRDEETNWLGWLPVGELDCASA